MSHGCTPEKNQCTVHELTMSPGQILVGLEGFRVRYSSNGCDCVYSFGFKVLDIKTGENPQAVVFVHVLSSEHAQPAGWIQPATACH